MSIEVVIRSSALDGIPVSQTTSHLALDTATDIALSRSVPGIANYSKIGPDLRLSFTDGQSLYIENFFVLSPQGEYSQLFASDGTALVTGLVAPEPEPKETALSAPGNGTGDPMIATEASGAEAREGSGVSMGDGASDDGAADAHADRANPLLLTGVGLASGYGSSFLATSEDGSSNSAALAATTSLAAEDRNTTDLESDADLNNEELDQEIAALIGSEEEVANNVSEVLALIGASASDTLSSKAATDTSVNTVETYQTDYDSLGGLSSDLQDTAIFNSVNETDFSAAMMIEDEI